MNAFTIPYPRPPPSSPLHLHPPHHSGCTGGHCAHSCKGDFCGARCVTSGQCAHSCKGSQCGFECVGAQCAHSCEGYRCAAYCTGAQCALNCKGVECDLGADERFQQGQACENYNGTLFHNSFACVPGHLFTHTLCATFALTTRVAVSPDTRANTTNMRCLCLLSLLITFLKTRFFFTARPMGEVSVLER